MEITKVLEEHTTYVCSVCGKQSFSERTIQLCEKRDTCEHNAIEYEFRDAEESVWRFHTEGIDLTCTKCGKLLDSVDFEDICTDQETLAAVFKYVKEIS